jgi:hypothetical protein
MPNETLVDPRVHDLAEFWLSDDDTTHQPKLHERRVMALAQAIQRAVEDWCDDEGYGDGLTPAQSAGFSSSSKS